MTQQVVKEKMSFGDKFRNLPQDTVLVVGDSMARGIGCCLERDSGLFSKLVYGGAKIEDIEQRLEVVGDKPGSHVVIVVGTNNLKREGSETILKRYESLMDKMQKRRYRKVTFVEVMKRTDVGNFLNSRRLGLNMRLKRLCDSNGFGFVETGVLGEDLGADGVHLNNTSQDKVARVIFQHCKVSLN